jgi:hypothetical protein
MERDEWPRAAWRVTVAHLTDPRRLVFVDEMGTNASLLRSWSRRGERARCAVPRNRGKNTTLLASMSVEGTGSSLAIPGAADVPRCSRPTCDGPFYRGFVRDGSW